MSLNFTKQGFCTSDAGDDIENFISWYNYHDNHDTHLHSSSLKGCIFVVLNKCRAQYFLPNPEPQ